MPIYAELKLTKKKYPELFKLKNKEAIKTLNKIIKAGYRIYYPKIKEINKNIKQNQLIENIDTKINSLENTLTKLIGVSNNSCKKGAVAENVLEKIFEERYGDIIYEKKNTVAHSGDAWLTIDNYKKIMIESKNYTNVVNKDEITKLEFDMKYHNIKWGIMISYNSRIQGYKDLDIHVFFHNDETYVIIMISNFSEDIYKLDLGLQVLRKLIINFDKMTLSPIYKNNIDKSINELTDIIRKNYQLRDSFYTLEKNIQAQLSLYYNFIREYQYDIDKKINEIISMGKNVNLSLLQKYENKKIFPLLSRFIDLCESKKLILNNGEILDNNKVIGSYKITLKNIVINIKNNIIIIENKENLEKIIL